MVMSMDMDMDMEIDMGINSDTETEMTIGVIHSADLIKIKRLRSKGPGFFVINIRYS
jgi:hypothetical protein